MTNPSITVRLTVDEARDFAALYPDKRYELHHGELTEVTAPKYNHRVMQERLHRLLLAVTESYGQLFLECAFRGSPEYNMRIADVALVSQALHREALIANELFGAPELIIEIISASNRAGEMDEKEAFCLDHGCQSFWLVNPVRQTVKVINAARQVQWFRKGDSIDLAPFAAGSLSVDEIFAH